MLTNTQVCGRVCSVLSFVAILALITALVVSPAFAQSAARITQPIDESNLVRLVGNTRSEANGLNDRGQVANDLPLEHLQLVLQRSAGLEQQLENLIAEQQRKGSPLYHKWLTPKQFGQRFGTSPQDIATLTQWLGSHGFTVESVFDSGMVMQFSGTAGQIKQAFHTEIHNLDVDGKQHIANMSDPKIPAALAGVVKGVYSLNDFMPHSMMKKRTDLDIVLDGDEYYALAPPDLATIYNLNPAFTAGYTGAGQTIVVIEDTFLENVSDVATFRSAFGLSGYSGTFSEVSPTGAATCTNPGVNGDEDEASLDAEWSGAAAPNASIVMAACADTATVFGGLNALQNLLNGPSASIPNVVSISYGECESENGASANASYYNTYQQAASEGVSVFVSSGDESAASCDADRSVATHGIAVSGFTSTPYNVSVGGTDFGDTYESLVGGPPLSTYWSPTNSATFSTALSYIPEIPWNDSCAGYLLYSLEGFTQSYGAGGFCNDTTIPGTSFRSTASGSGGPSNCATGAPTTGETGVTSGTCAGYAKPSWQSGLVGNPADGVRDIPDVSLFAANGLWSHFYVYCLTDTSEGGAPACDYTNASDVNDLAAGGTSFSSPIMAGIQALVNQANGESYQGLPTPRYYALAGLEYGATGDSACNSSLGTGANSSCVFYDVTLGDMDVNCDEDVSRGHPSTVIGTFDCYGTVANGTTVTYQGALSTSNNVLGIAYGTNAGWDFPTGIGTVNAYNLIQNWTSVQSTTSVSSSLNPSSYGASVSFTATVTPAIGSTETGSVQFYVDGNLFDTETLSSGSATSVSTSTLTPGTHTVSATYSGDSNYSGSTGSLSGGQVVQTAAAYVTVQSSGSPSTYGQAVTFTATINGANGLIKRGNRHAGPMIVTGTVSWSSNTGCPTTNVTSGGPGTSTATCTTSALLGGGDTVTANYSGDSNHNPGSGSIIQTVNRANPTVSFTGLPSSTPFNTTYALVATTNASTTAVLTDNSPTVCSLSGSTVTIVADSGRCSVTAAWAADNNYNSATLTQSSTVAKGAAVITWATPAAISYGTPLSGTQLDSTATPSNVYTTAVYSPVAGKVLDVGSQTLKVTYAPHGDSSYATTTDEVTLQVQQASTSTTNTPVNQTVTLGRNGTVNDTIDFTVSSYKPTGTVQVSATGPGTEFCQGVVGSLTGKGSCRLTFSQAGTWTITASYPGDANHTGSTSSGTTVTVNP